MNLHVNPAAAPLRGTAISPSSKNYTTRFLLASCLAQGTSEVIHPAVSDDAVAMVECARTLGARVEAFDESGAPIAFSVATAAAIHRVRIEGFGAAPRLTRPDGTPDPNPAAPTVPVNPHNAGAVLRMIMGAGALLPAVTFITDHPDSLGTRPNADLLEAFRTLDIECEPRTPKGELPITLRGGRERIARALDRLAAANPRANGIPVIPVSGDVSSQFVSSILFLAPLLGRPVDIEVIRGLKSQPLVETTVEVLREAGIQIEAAEDWRYFRVRGGGYRPRRWSVNGDWPGASALLAAAAVVPSSQVRVPRLRPDLQGERRVLDILEAMGCRAERHWIGACGTADAPAGADGTDAASGVVIAAPDVSRPLHALEIDGDTCTDGVLALYAAAALAEGTTRIHGIRNLQFKECDRIRRPIQELRAVYATNAAYQKPDGSPDAAALDAALAWRPADDPDIAIIRGEPSGFEGGIEVDGCGDHRVIMMLSIVALRCRKGLTIRGVEHVAKSFPGWFDAIRAIGVTTR